MATTQDHAPPGACGHSDLAKGRVSVSMLSAGGIIGQRLQHIQQLRHVRHLLADDLRVQPATELVEVDVQHLSPAVRETHPVAAGQLPGFVHHLVEPAVPLVGPALRQGDGLAMRAAAPQPCSDAWCRSPAARYPPGFVQELPGLGGVPQTVSIAVRGPRRPTLADSGAGWPQDHPRGIGA